MTWNPAEDGVTHINVYSKGRTELGRFLSNFARAPFDHPEHGRFESVEGLWYWLTARDDRLRSVWGWEAKRLGRELRGEDWVDAPEFRRDIRIGIAAKLATYPDMADMLGRSTLPLAHYYTYDDKVIEPAQGRWVIDYLSTFQNHTTSVPTT